MAIVSSYLSIITKMMLLKVLYSICQQNRKTQQWPQEKTLESSLDRKEIKPVNPKGNQPWIFTGRTDAEAGAPIFWPPDVKSWLTGKDPDAGKYWRQEEKGMTEDEMVGSPHWLSGHEFEQALGVGDGQGSLTCCSPWGCKESDTTEQLNWTETKFTNWKWQNGWISNNNKNLNYTWPVRDFTFQDTHRLKLKG